MFLLVSVVSFLSLSFFFFFSFFPSSFSFLRKYQGSEGQEVLDLDTESVKVRWKKYMWRSHILCLFVPLVAIKEFNCSHLILKAWVVWGFQMVIHIWITKVIFATICGRNFNCEVTSHHGKRLNLEARLSPQPSKNPRVPRFNPI